MKPGKKKFQETIHRLINAVEPRWDILTVVILVESINHLPHIVEPIKEVWRLNIGVAYSCTNILKTPTRHVLRQTEGRALKHIDRLLRPPYFVVLNPLKSCHKEVTAHPYIEILEGNMRSFNIFVCHRYDNLPDKILGEAHLENIKLQHFCNRTSTVVFTSPLGIMSLLVFQIILAAW